MQVMHLRCRLSQLKLGLGKGYALRHRKDIRIADWNHVDSGVKVGRKHRSLRPGHLIRVFLRQVIGKDAGQNAELGLLGIVQALVDRRHDFHAALKKGDRGPDRGLLVHAPGLLICE